MTRPPPPPDEQSAVRTALANERTLLSYVRTTLALVIAGATVLEFFEGRYMKLLGFVMMLGGVVTVAIGVWRYRTLRRRVVRALPLPNDDED